MQNYSKLNRLPTIVEEDEPDKGDGYNGPTFRCSVQKVKLLLSQFDQQKRDIVTSMDWGGTLSMPLISKLSVRHMVWLLGAPQLGRSCAVWSKYASKRVSKICIVFLICVIMQVDERSLAPYYLL
ncbi:hypothetical protein ACQJBY_032394 [Aegilops geniculata]